jgi:hypothetical protein
MSIKSQGGIFGRNPTFNDVTVDGDLSVGGSNVVVDSNIGSTVQGYDADTAKLDVAQTWTATQDFAAASATSLGVGTTNPQQEIHVVAPAACLRLEQSGSGYAEIISSDFGIMYLDCDKGDEQANSTMRFRIDSSEKIRLQTNGNWDMSYGGGNLKFASGSGIDFSATSGTGTSELFDDYEEGTWTPTFAITGGSFSAITYNTFTGGNYTKIGNMVAISGYITTNSLTVGTGGDLVISGLPFAPANTTGLSERSGVTIGSATNWSSGYPISGRLQSGTTSIFLQKRSAVDGATSAVQASDMGTTTQDNELSFSVVYFT